MSEERAPLSAGQQSNSLVLTGTTSYSAPTTSLPGFRALLMKSSRSGSGAVRRPNWSLHQKCN